MPVRVVCRWSLAASITILPNWHDDLRTTLSNNEETTSVTIVTCALYLKRGDVTEMCLAWRPTSRGSADKQRDQRSNHQPPCAKLTVHQTHLIRSCCFRKNM